MSDHRQAELRFLGIASSPAFVRPLQGKRVRPVLIRVLKERILWAHWFETIEDLKLALLPTRNVTTGVAVERHSHRTPSQVRAILRAALAA